LHLLCGGAPAGPTQSCTRTIQVPETIRGVAGHMHLLGRSIKIEVNPGTPRARTILNIKVWDFDNQGSVPTPPIRLKNGDTVKVTCTHTQTLRDALPALKGIGDKYVVWGDGTTDEMCLGILLVTRP
jgi:FtsP/CotA-like multicopper oxidase with cupredoxin domain